jgi:hypothetical protein
MLFLVVKLSFLILVGYLGINNLNKFKGCFLMFLNLILLFYCYIINIVVKINQKGAIKLKNVRITLYIPEDLKNIFDDIKKNKNRLNESKNIIYTKCIVLGLKELYEIDFENDDLRDNLKA